MQRFRGLINQQLDTVEDVNASPGKRKRALELSTALVPQLGQLEAAVQPEQHTHYHGTAGAGAFQMHQQSQLPPGNPLATPQTPGGLATVQRPDLVAHPGSQNQMQIVPAPGQLRIGEPVQTGRARQEENEEDIPTFRGLADKMVTIRQECAANAFKRDVKKK